MPVLHPAMLSIEGGSVESGAVPGRQQELKSWERSSPTSTSLPKLHLNY